MRSPKFQVSSLSATFVRVTSNFDLIWKILGFFYQFHQSGPLLTTRSKVRVLSVSQRFLALNTFVKQEQITRKSIIKRILRKVSWMTTMKVVDWWSFFGFFGAIGATVLVISPKRIELEGCTCAQIKALEKWNCSIYADSLLCHCRRHHCRRQRLHH